MSSSRSQVFFCPNLLRHTLCKFHDPSRPFGHSAKFTVEYDMLKICNAVF